MVIIGTPNPENLEDYYIADDLIAVELSRKGFLPKYRDGDAVYFLLNKKLRKALSTLNIEVDINN